MVVGIGLTCACTGGKLMAATASGHVTALQLGASKPAAEDAEPASAQDLPVERCTSQPLPPATPTKLTVQLEQTAVGNGVPARSGRPALPRPVLLTDEFEDTSAAVSPPHLLLCCFAVSGMMDA